MNLTVSQATEEEKELLVSKISSLYGARGEKNAKSISELLEYAEKKQEFDIYSTGVVRFETGFAYLFGSPNIYVNGTMYISQNQNFYRVSTAVNNIDDDNPHISLIQKNGYEITNSKNDSENIHLTVKKILQFIKNK